MRREVTARSSATGDKDDYCALQAILIIHGLGHGYDVVAATRRRMRKRNHKCGRRVILQRLQSRRLEFRFQNPGRASRASSTTGGKEKWQRRSGP